MDIAASIQKVTEDIMIKLSKSLVSTRAIKKGEVITRDMLTTKGPFLPNKGDGDPSKEELARGDVAY